MPKPTKQPFLRADFGQIILQKSRQPGRGQHTFGSQGFDAEGVGRRANRKSGVEQLRQLQKFEQVRGHARYSIIEDRVILKNYRTIRYSLALYTKEHLPHM